MAEAASSEAPVPVVVYRSVTLEQPLTSRTPPARGRPILLLRPESGGPPAPVTLTRWNYAARYLAARACAVARRNLTRLEWEQVLPNVPYAKVCPQYPLPKSSVALPPTG